jgi:hypothetical protein
MYSKKIAPFFVAARQQNIFCFIGVALPRICFFAPFSVPP